MGDIGSTEEMNSVASTLHDGAANLDSLGESPTANAGESIGIVQQALGRLMQASAGVSNGLHQAADDVQASREQYMRDDDAGRDNLPGGPR